MYWPPNIDAVRWFHKKIWPEIKKAHPDVTLTIIGKRPPRSIRRLSSDTGINVLGYEPDPIPILIDCAAFIVPLRIGGGIRVKILTAMAWGLPVVSTSVGAEGIECRNNGNILVRDTHDTFVQAVIDLLQDNCLSNKLAAEARKLVESKYDWRIIYTALQQELKDINQT